MTRPGSMTNYLFPLFGFLCDRFPPRVAIIAYIILMAVPFAWYNVRPYVGHDGPAPNGRWVDNRYYPYSWPRGYK